MTPWLSVELPSNLDPAPMLDSVSLVRAWRKKKETAERLSYTLPSAQPVGFRSGERCTCIGSKVVG